MKNWSRRNFLKLALGTPLIGVPLASQANEVLKPREIKDPPVPRKVPVIMATSKNSVVRFVFNDAIIAEMASQAVARLFGKPTIGEAFKELFKPSDVVGLKVNASGGPVTSTHKGVVNAMISGLSQAGVPARQIIIWDKYRNKLEEAHYYKTNWKDGVQVLATSPDAGYDPAAQYDFEAVGQLIWGDHEFDPNQKTAMGEDILGNRQLSNKSHFSSIITKKVNKVINLASLSDHPDLGVYGCLANIVIGATDNSRRFCNDPYYGDPALHEIYSRPWFRKKTVFHLLDSLLVTYAGGPEFSAEFSDHTNRIIVTTDPVAADSIGLDILSQLRTKNKVDVPPHFGTYIQAAADQYQGINNRSQMMIQEFDI
ncbi:MAG: DUF362 domain-containing protein [Verrucomicrobiota bacterium]|nr:DUF362 domain-containing protein [Verrucomicrobiota bacterium]